jgi:multicomponent Na+:H+ antiporter subunit B
LKRLGLIAIIVFGGLLFTISFELPDLGDAQSPASTHVSPYYIEHTLEDTSVPNIVTAILADYRGYDTLFETAVIFSAGLACFFLLRIPERKGAAPKARFYRHLATGLTLRIEKGGRIPEESKEFERIDSVWVPSDVIINMTCRLVVPFVQLFALYVIAHGHHSPGGGFQGGVIFGAAIILFAISNNLRSTTRRLSERNSALLGSGGVIIYLGTGLLCILLGAGFLNYSGLSVIPGLDPVSARSYGILIVEVGVGIAVTAVMVWIYYNLASAGTQEEGL